jgi:uncharacterized membrane protein YdcZ (DUF606 family)
MLLFLVFTLEVGFVTDLQYRFNHTLNAGPDLSIGVIASFISFLLFIALAMFFTLLFFRFRKTSKQTEKIAEIIVSTILSGLVVLINISVIWGSISVCGRASLRC